MEDGGVAAASEGATAAAGEKASAEETTEDERQRDESFTVHPTRRPQNKQNADKPGCYNIVFRIPRTEAAHGEWAEIDIYITGYGLSSEARLYFMPPTSFVEPGSCSVAHSLGLGEDGRGHWGAKHMDSADEGMTLDLSSGGLTQRGWDGPSLFFDIGSGIATESSTPEPPVKVKFKIRRTAATGDHTINFALTYFNGREWSIDNRVAVIHVPTLYERYEGLAWAIGAAIAAVTLITSVVAIFVALAAVPADTAGSSTHPARPVVPRSAASHKRLGGTASPNSICSKVSISCLTLQFFHVTWCTSGRRSQGTSSASRSPTVLFRRHPWPRNDPEELLKVLAGNEASSAHFEIAETSASHFVVQQVA